MFEWNKLRCQKLSKMIIGITWWSPISFISCSFQQKPCQIDFCPRPRVSTSPHPPCPPSEKSWIRYYNMRWNKFFFIYILHINPIQSVYLFSLKVSMVHWGHVPPLDPISFNSILDPPVWCVPQPWRELTVECSNRSKKILLCTNAGKSETLLDTVSVDLYYEIKQLFTQDEKTFIS